MGITNLCDKGSYPDISPTGCSSFRNIAIEVTLWKKYFLCDLQLKRNCPAFNFFLINLSKMPCGRGDLSSSPSSTHFYLLWSSLILIANWSCSVNVSAPLVNAFIDTELHQDNTVMGNDLPLDSLRPPMEQDYLAGLKLYQNINEIKHDLGSKRQWQKKYKTDYLNAEDKRWNIGV